MPLPITFLSDYGYRDEFAGLCRAVIARIAPDARVVDLTHGLPRHAVRQGALVLADALPYAEAGVHLAVVDPGVGSERRPVALRTAEEGRFLVGPDNGLLSPALERFGGAAEAVDLSDSTFRLEPTSATFHGRDVFAPVAARLAAGAALLEAGEPLDPADLTRLELPRAKVDGDRILAHVVYVDGFGNAALDLDSGEAAAAFIHPGARVAVAAEGITAVASCARTFSDVDPGRPLLYEDSGRRLALAVNCGSAAELLGLEPDDEVALSPAP